MKRILLICAFLFALAVQAGAQSKQQQQQPVEVNGLVVDSDDVPIVGATVYIKDEPGIVCCLLCRYCSLHGVTR